MAALLLVDVQNDFLRGGALAITDGDATIPVAHRLLEMSDFSLILASQDYHPPGHISFASSHPGEKVFTTISIPRIDSLNSTPSSTEFVQQELWPEHCIRGTTGCELEAGVLERMERIRKARGEESVLIVRKGVDMNKDAYSAFATPLDHPAGKPSEIAESLIQNEIKLLFVIGLATDFCVQASVRSALTTSNGRWTTYIVKDGVRGVDAANSEAALARLSGEGAIVVGIDEVAGILCDERMRSSW